MKILLTNDDGIGADGIQALHNSVQQWKKDHSRSDIEVVVIAPNQQRSECSHSISSGRAFQVEMIRPGWYSVDGTPVDCVRVGLDGVAKDATIVISGVNQGANLGADLLISGTYAAAREAALSGRPALAVSHYRRPDVERTWQHVSSWLSPILTDFFQIAGDEIADDGIAEDGEGASSPAPLWNVNLPAIDPATAPSPPIVYCDVDQNLMVRQGHHDSDEIHFTSNFHDRPRTAGHDVDACFGGNITISKIQARIG